MQGSVKKAAMFLLVLITVFAVAAGLASCIQITGLTGSGNVVSEERTVSGFNTVALSAGMNLYLEQGDTEYCRIEAEDNIIAQIITEVKDGKLSIRYRNFLGGISNRKPVNVFVTFKNLSQINASSGSRVECGLINSDSLKIGISSGATGEFTVSAENIDIGLSSGAQMKISGEVKSQNVRLSSGVVYNAEDLKSSNADLKVSSGAQARISVSDNLSVDISSGGSVFYTGNPRIISNISSGGLLKSN